MNTEVNHLVLKLGWVADHTAWCRAPRRRARQGNSLGSGVGSEPMSSRPKTYEQGCGLRSGGQVLMSVCGRPSENNGRSRWSAGDHPNREENGSQLRCGRR